MAKNDIFDNFPFFRFANYWKNAKMEYTCAQFLLFYVFVFNQKRKKQKNEIYFVEFSIFPFLDQNRKIGKLKFVSLEFLFFNFFKKW